MEITGSQVGRDLGALVSSFAHPHGHSGPQSQIPVVSHPHPAEHVPAHPAVLCLASYLFAARDAIELFIYRKE